MSEDNVGTSVNEAILLATKGHDKDRWGDYPYTTHLALVAQRVVDNGQGSDNAVATAWLHDLYEDHPQYEDELRAKFPEIWGALDLLAHDPSQGYMEYVQQVVDSGDEVALAVKYADLQTNLENKPVQESMRDRYRAAIHLIENSGKLPKTKG